MSLSSEKRHANGTSLESFCMDLNMIKQRVSFYYSNVLSHEKKVMKMKQSAYLVAFREAQSLHVRIIPLPTRPRRSFRAVLESRAERTKVGGKFREQSGNSIDFLVRSFSIDRGFAGHRTIISSRPDFSGRKTNLDFAASGSRNFFPSARRRS